MGKRASGSQIEIKVQTRGGDHDEASPLTPQQQRPVAGAVGRQQQRPSDGWLFRKWTPWLMPAFVVVNMVMFVVVMYVNDCPKNSPGGCVPSSFGRFAFQPLKENPLLGPSATTLDNLGALDVRKVVDGRQWWRLLSCIWLHAGLVHVLANMFSLALVGSRLEQEFGFAKVGLLYLLSGFGGSLLSALFSQSTISVGASGALFGLLGAMLSELLTNWTIYANKLSALSSLVLIIAINLAVGILPHVDNLAHIGGFVSGFLLGFVILIRPQFGWVNQKNIPLEFRSIPLKRRHKVYQYILWVLSAVLVTVGFIVGLIMLLRGIDGNEYCSWCRYLSCVPTSFRSCSPPTRTISCLSTQRGSNLNLACEGTRTSRNYHLPNATDAQIDELCSQLCA